MPKSGQCNAVWAAQQCATTVVRHTLAARRGARVKRTAVLGPIVTYTGSRGGPRSTGHHGTSVARVVGVDESAPAARTITSVWLLGVTARHRSGGLAIAPPHASSEDSASQQAEGSLASLSGTSSGDDGARALQVEGQRGPTLATRGKRFVPALAPSER